MSTPHPLMPLLKTIRFQLEMLNTSVKEFEQQLNNSHQANQTQNDGIGTPGVRAPVKRKMSAAGRRRIAEATRKRWADKRKAEAAAAASRPAAKKSVQAKRAAS